VVVNGPEVLYLNKGVTQPIKRLIEILAEQSYQSKEYLIGEVWNYKYNPGVHDNLLHATLSKIRNLLGPLSNWIEWSNKGYRLSAHVQVRKPETQNVAKLIDSDSAGNSGRRGDFQLPPASYSRLETLANSTSRSLNIRQVKLLKAMKPDGAISVRELARRYRISTMTAFRDITYLLELGLVVKLGRGRSTVYCLP